MSPQSEKEILNQLLNDDGEKHPVIDAEPNPEVAKEIQSYLEKVEKEQFLAQPITDNYGQPLVSPPAPQQPKIVLPITQNQYLAGFKQKVTESIRWLVAWCGRLIKILDNRASFRKNEI